MMIKNSGIAPESLPFEEDLNDVKKQLKSTARKMNKLDAPVQKKVKATKPT